MQYYSSFGLFQPFENMQTVQKEVAWWGGPGGGGGGGELNLALRLRFAKVCFGKELETICFT